MKTILVPTDFSKGSIHALRYSAILAYTAKAKLELLHVHTSLSGPLQSFADEKVNLKKAMMEQVSYIMRKFPSVRISWKIESGQADKKIIMRSRQIRPLLVVIGNTSRNIVTRSLLGRTASSVARFCPCPVLMVPPNAKPSLSLTVTVASDAPEKNWHNLAPLLPLVKELNAELQFVQTASEDQDPQVIVKQMRKALKYKKISFHAEHCCDINEGLRHFIRTHKPSMLSILSPDRGSIEDLWKPTRAQSMYNHISIPLLVFGNPGSLFDSKAAISSVNQATHKYPYQPQTF